jgi:hypothetical protein
MANYDHADNIGTHPAVSQDPETRSQARLAAAEVQFQRAREAWRIARQNLRDFENA